jgi:dihydrodipicolinate synthase/N-acetylneuraminate lyase
VQLFFDGRTEKALARYAELHRLIAVTGGRRGVASLKACMNELGYRAGVPRRPVPALADGDREDLRAALVAAGKLDGA